MSALPDNRRTATRCVHAGEGVDAQAKALRRPIHMANSFELPCDVDVLLNVFSWEHLDSFQYTRIGDSPAENRNREYGVKLPCHPC